MINHSRPTIEPDDLCSILDVLQSKDLVQGRKVKELEQRFCEYVGMNFGLAANSGTSALHLGLLALGIGQGDEVIIPSYICSAVLNAVLYTGASPIVVDISDEDFNIDIEDTRKKITSKTKAVVVPHIFGTPARIDEFMKLGLPVIEDCAQAIGASYKGQMVGSFGDISIFSFYATKMMTTGEGGMALTNRQDLLERMRELRDYDNKETFKIRYNYKMADFQAALGLSQLSKLPRFIEKRRTIAGIYTEKMSGCGFNLPVSHADREGVFYRYVIKADKNSKRIIQEMNQAGIEVKRPVYKPIHQYLNLDAKNYINTEMAIAKAISIPVYPSLKEGEINFICENLHRLSLDILEREAISHPVWAGYG